MKPDILTTKDFWSGLMLVATGAAAIFFARTYPFGTSLRMGPGYFPTVLGWVLIGFGLVLLARSLRSTDYIEGSWSLRALIVLPLAFAAFGLLLDRAGFIPALVVLLVGSAAASPTFRWGEVALMTLVLTACCVAVFIFGLGLPYRLVAGF